MDWDFSCLPDPPILKESSPATWHEVSSDQRPTAPIWGDSQWLNVMGAFSWRGTALGSLQRKTLSCYLRRALLTAGTWKQTPVDARGQTSYPEETNKHGKVPDRCLSFQQQKMHSGAPSAEPRSVCIPQHTCRQPWWHWVSPARSRTLHSCRQCCLGSTRDFLCPCWPTGSQGV